jgi:hypothetical protein
MMPPEPWKTLSSRIVYEFRVVYGLVLSGKIRDSLTTIAVLHAARLREWQ